jgi:hypothetical protein
MQGYKLTIEQKESIQGLEYAPYQSFNCVQDYKDNWFTFLTDEDKTLISKTEFNWLLDLDLVEFWNVIYKAPPLSPYAVVIPEIYQWAFPENKFVLSGFEIPLDTTNGVKCVNLAYFNWQAFRDELDNGNYVALKRSLMELWDYVKLQADTIGPWMQDPQNNQLSDKVIIL